MQEEKESDKKGKKRCVYETVNPKAVSSDELYGYMTLAKDWKDGEVIILLLKITLEIKLNKDNFLLSLLNRL